MNSTNVIVADSWWVGIALESVPHHSGCAVSTPTITTDNDFSSPDFTS